MPSQYLLKKYADILVKYALWNGKGLQPGQTVFLYISESAKPLLIPLQTSVLEAGGYPLLHYVPEGIGKSFYENANEDQIKYHAQNYLKGRLEDIDCQIGILSDTNPHELEGVDSKKIMERQKALKFYQELRHKKEDEGKYFWTLALFGTEEMAHEAGLSLEEYWEQIIKACFLDKSDPVEQWREINIKIQETVRHLNDLKIEWIQIIGQDVDLKIKIGTNRKWLGGGGNNIPSFEIFTSPDWHGTEGWITFNQPLYTHGTLVKGIHLEFKGGIIVSCSAQENEPLLKDMISVENADKLGEFSLTDKRFSRIDKFMAETLFDENFGGEFGNTHIAIGTSFHQAYSGDGSNFTKEYWDKLGFNTSVVHTDIISTTNRTVTATLSDGSERVIYKDGMFEVE